MSSTAGTSAQDDACDALCPSRRSVLLAAAAAGTTVALAGCQTYGAQPVSNAPIADDPSAGAGDPTALPTELPEELPEGDGAETGGEVLASLSDIPVGGGVVFAAQGVVLTHPKEGTVRAFSDNCTHAGCKVNQVSGGTINCPCHGSKFRVADGSVAAGPAGGPLAAVKVRVDGDSILLV